MIDLLRHENATIVDVRTEAECFTGKVENSIVIPMHEVPGRVDEFKAMSKPLILVCATGNRSGQVARFLASRGVTDVYNGGGWYEVQEVLETNKLTTFRS